MGQAGSDMAVSSLDSRKWTDDPWRADRVDVLGVMVDRVGMMAALEAIDGFIDRNERRVAVFPNAFCVTLARRDPSYRMALNTADLVLPDGTPIIWASRVLGSPVPERVCGPDLFEQLNARAAARGFSVYFLGGAIPRNAERVAAAVQALHPTLRIAGTFTPPAGAISGELAAAILADIASVQPDILWVGLGSPMQESWILRNRASIAARVTLAVGGTFNYYNGTRCRAPSWMRNHGFEWLHRVLLDVTLIWKKRFFALPYEFFVPMGLQALRRRRRE
jgi:N-acetylglucosaminyldiphosphoundecaprenol N-acetyl-beta-D-mannosaminyltransferase